MTFLFSDIEGSTRLWQSHATAMQAALPRHDQLLRSVFARHGGQVFATGGDGFAVAFARAADARSAATEAQAALAAEDWPADAVLRVRVGIHTGEAVERDGDYFGSAVNRTARLMALAHGGQVVCTSTTLGVVEEPPPTLDLGEHRLRDLLAPVHVHQVGTEPFPPLRSNALVPTNLPTPPTDLIGREDDVATLVADLGTHRLVTVTGVGGMGKTRLAIEVAGALAGEHPDGVWFVDLAPALDGGDVVRAVGTAMGATGASSGTDALVDHLAGRTTLVVLDNCEHVIDAAAGLAEQILAQAPEVRLLATSREPLDVAGEVVKHLRPLALPDPATLGGSATDYPATQLFEARAAAARSGFTVDEHNLDDVVEICRRLDGMPLAIELAAARVGAMSTADIRARLGERFRLPTSVLNTQAVALCFTDPAAALPIAAEVLEVADRIALSLAVADALTMATVAAIALDERDAAARLHRHNLATEEFPSPHNAWLRRDVVGTLGEVDLTPESLGRNELFALLVELQERHPVAGA